MVLNQLRSIALRSIVYAYGSSRKMWHRSFEVHYYWCVVSTVWLADSCGSIDAFCQCCCRPLMTFL